MRKIGLLSLALLQNMLFADSIRESIGGLNLVDHLKGEVRVGYIGLNDSGVSDSFAVGGHLHLQKELSKNFKVAIEGYAVDHFGWLNDNGDFFDENKDGFATISQAYLGYENSGYFLKIGRQILDTPHLDSDDIRMMPNYFEATLGGYSGDDFEVLAGFVDKMAGWENGVDAKRFINLNEVLGVDNKSSNLYMLNLKYKSFDFWHYEIDDVARIEYLEFSKEFSWFSFALQCDLAKDVGSSLVGKVDSLNVGVMTEAKYDNLSGFLAFNREFKDGSFGSFGGGAFFTSMEDQTIDAVGLKAKSFVVGAGYEINGVNLSVAYGKFKSDDESYDVDEVDFGLEYEIKDNVNFSLYFADVSGYEMIRSFLRIGI